ncbi:MAG TPA: polysaccharide biosynthesis tyrosine autokinase [Thermoanaerobaculia bacterium]|nr:polysaccharide biosynthesis tyrosine autokinase [Thermoanaerobaculia bacterium]
MSNEWTSFEESAAPEPEHNPVHLAEYWHIIVKRWRLVAACLAAGLLAAAAVSLLSRPAYKAVAVLEIERPAGTSLGVGTIGEHSMPYDSEFLPTQMSLMKSREIAERVVRKLGLVAAAAPTSAARGTGPRQAKSAAAAAVRLDPVTRAAIGVQKEIDTVPVRGTNLVELTYVSSSSARAADLANAVAEAYIEWTIDAKLRAAGNTSQFLNSQVAQFQAEVASREQELLAFRRERDLTSDSKTNVTVTNGDALNGDYAAAVRERVAKEARLYEVRNTRSDALASANSDGSLAQARIEQARLEREYADKLDLFKPEWPAMQQLKAQIDKGRQGIDILIQDAAVKVRAAAGAEYQAAIRREESLKSEIRSQKAAVLNQNGADLDYNQKKLELQTKQALLDNLLKRKAEADVLSGLAGERLSNVRIVDRALPPGAPFRPSYARNGLLGLLGGALAGLGLAFFVSYLDRSLRTPEQVEQVLQLPALGAIPSVGAAGGWVQRSGYSVRLPQEPGKEAMQEEIELLPHRQPRSQIAECYRSLRTALLLSRAGGVRSFVVTSGLPQEGKTVTAVNLSIVLSQLGKKVLLVDADLHRPRLHEIFRLSNRTGLVSILAEDVLPGSAIAGTDIPDLFVVPSGPSSPNPSGLLSSEAMSQWLDDARKAFDYVILDTPPIQLVADAIVLAHLTDGAVLCVRSGETPRERVTSTRDRMLRSGIRILGVLLNGVEGDESYGEVYAYDQTTLAAHRLTPEKPVAAASRSL